VVGRAFPDFFDTANAPAVRTLLGGIRAAGRAEPLEARLAHAAQEVTVSAHTFRQDSEHLCLVRLVPATVTQPAALAPAAHDRLLRLVQSAPDGFVVTSADGQIITANTAFLAMTQLASEQQARGQPLDRWLGRPGVDLQVLIAQLRQHGSVRLFATTVRDEFGPGMEVEISAVAITNGGQPCYGFAIRNIGRRLPSAAAPGQTAVRALPRPVEQLTELIGRASLKELVRDATDIIERLCIAAALEMTGDNRASAAEILGLSRQSLYVKLRRYGLGDLAPDGGGL
jgi:transcriptional regulator PpsR